MNTHAHTKEKGAWYASSISELSKLRFREYEKFAQGLIISNWQSFDKTRSMMSHSTIRNKSSIYKSMSKWKCALSKLPEFTF